MLLDRHDRARIEEAVSANSISIVEPAITPILPSRPNTRLNLVIGLLVGLVGGCGLAFLLENFDPSIHSLNDLTQFEDLQPLGWVPSVPRPTKNGFNPMIFKPNDRSHVSESFGILSTNITSSASGEMPKTILITSPEPSVGKSTVLSNLALALSKSGREVIVVDADLRKPSLHNAFDMANDRGLSNVLFDPRLLDESLRWTRFKSVKALFSGMLRDSAIEKLATPTMKEIIDSLANQCDIVLIDSPPVLVAADATVLSQIVDGVLIVCAREETSVSRLGTTLDRLDLVGARVIGVVLNKAQEEEREYDYYGHYK